MFPIAPVQLHCEKRTPGDENLIKELENVLDIRDDVNNPESND
jgi:hypothetical protein